MSKKNQKHPGPRNLRIKKELARPSKPILSSLAISSLLAACAPTPHVKLDTSHSAYSSGSSILYVRNKSKRDGVEDDGDAKDPSYASSSPSSRYIPMPSDVPIFEKLLSKYRITTHGETVDPKHAKLKSLPPNPKYLSARIAHPSPIQIGSPIPLNLSSKALKDGIWDRVRKRLMLTSYQHESVLAEVERIRRSPGILGHLSKRAEPYLFYIVDEIERRGLPMDLVMVPMVESAFEPTAVSPKQAAGIWQIIPGTAVDNGLKLVDGYDGRYDVYASTKAALKYLSRLQGMFGGDWLLALAAYNAGEGAVQRAIQANQKAGLGTSFWELNLPAETKAYVPKILALSRVVSDPISHGVNLHKISSLPYLARIEVNSPVPLAQAVESAGMSWAEFSALNPAFKPDVSPDAPFNLLLPMDKAQSLVTNLQGSRLIAARKYVVKKGETLTVIARQQGVPAMKLAEWNGLTADSRVKPGQELIIYPV